MTTLTKRMAEDLTDYYRELGVRVRYLHSDIDTLERIDILRDLRLGEFDVLVGINLLREGLDLPEVSLVAIFDADKEGFLRSPRSLIQTIGRAARNVNGRVIMYADSVTPAMKSAIEETGRAAARSSAQYNLERGIIPETVVRAIMNINPASGTIDYLNVPKVGKGDRPAASSGGEEEMQERIAAMRLDMFTAAENLDFEKAARLRDELKKFQALVGGEAAAPAAGDGAFDPYAGKKGKRGRGTVEGQARGRSQRPSLQGALGSCRSRRAWQRVDHGAHVLSAAPRDDEDRVVRLDDDEVAHADQRQRFGALRAPLVRSRTRLFLGVDGHGAGRQRVARRVLVGQLPGDLPASDVVPAEVARARPRWRSPSP